jgi:hypothetical protein
MPRPIRIGRPGAFAELFGLLDTPLFWFNIVTP